MVLLSTRGVTMAHQLASTALRCRKWIYLRHLRKVSTVGDGISDTTLLMQDGMNIEELPLVVKRVSSSQVLFRNIETTGTVETNDSKSQNLRTPDNEELQEVVDGFKRCNSLHEVFKLLDIVPSNFIKPKVAFQIVKKMMELDRVYSAFAESVSAEDMAANFTKTAIFSQLINVILTNGDPGVVIGCLRLMNQNKAFRQYLQPYEEKILELVILNVTQNKYGVLDVCDLVKEMDIAGHSDNIDKFWVGIVDNTDTIDNHNILKAYQSLPHFKHSRAVIANKLLERMNSCWWKLEGRDLAEIISLTKKTRTHSHKLLQIFGRWLNTKIHSINEEELLLVVNGFSSVDFVNSQVIAALERYIKMRGDLINNSCLFAAIMDYCLHFGIRSIPILEKACDYFISRANTIPPVVVKSLFVPFGILNYSPTRSYEFWKTFDNILDEKFSYFNPEHVLDIMLACIYLEKYPINFVNSVFDPYFLQRLQISCKNWSVTKRNLVLFDHMMTNECKAYRGPLVSRDSSIGMKCTDERIKFLLGKLRRPLVEMVGSADRVLVNKCLRVCNLQSACTVDVLLVPEDARMPYLNNFTNTKMPYVALLIHLPEHYIYESEDLIGPQAMRKRHIERLGLAVVSLNHFHLMKLSASPTQLIRFLDDAIQEAEMNHMAK